MDANLHAPTIPSGPTTIDTNGSSLSHLSLRELDMKKKEMEAEFSALGGVLESHGVNMNTPLMTPDGFPRADLDVAQVRTTRARIIRLRNDHKALMELIEKRVHEEFANQSDIQGQALATQNLTTVNGTTLEGAGVNGTSRTRSRVDALDIPFAKINTVSSGSPADSAGLKAGDEIRNFGYVNHSNHDNLRRLADVVQGNEGREVLIKVSRVLTSGPGREELRLTLTPRRDWGGRGMLGCHVLPL